MPEIVTTPVLVESAGTLPKIIQEFFGCVSTGNRAISIARMKSPPGWEEPGQTPEFDEYTLVLEGSLSVTSKDGSQVVQAGQAILVKAGEWVRYSTPGPDGADYVAVCLPAFSPESVHRDE